LMMLMGRSSCAIKGPAGVVLAASGPAYLRAAGTS
jgi:hypothetical protein